MIYNAFVYWIFFTYVCWMILYSCLLIIAGFADDFTKCTSRFGLWKRQEIFKGLLFTWNFLISSALEYCFWSVLFFQSFKELVATCLVKDPKKRPASEKLLKHPFFKHARPNEYLAHTILDGLSPLGDRFKMLKVSFLSEISPPNF